MTDADLQHARDWDGDDVTNWHASEKFDGCRAYWDGVAMYSRSGIPVALPDAIAATLPPYPLDGELFRADLAPSAIGHIMRGRGRGWDGITFRAFDAPRAAGGWRERLATIRATGFCVPVAAWRVASADQAISDMRRVQSRGGEGIMLRRPDVPYTAGRTRDILKMKDRGL